MDLARLHPNSRAGIKTGERKAQPLFDSFPGIFNWHGKHNTKYSVLQKKHKHGLPIGEQTKKSAKKKNLNQKTHHLVDLTKERKSCSEKQIK